MNVNEFVNYVLDRDELSTLLKCHLYIETHLEQIILKLLPEPNFFLGQSFYTKVQLLRSTGLLPDKTYKDLLSYNKIRNKYSHKIKNSLTADDIAVLVDMNRDSKITPEITDKYKLDEKLGIKNFGVIVLAGQDIVSRLKVIRDAADKISHKELPLVFRAIKESPYC